MTDIRDDLFYQYLAGGNVLPSLSAQAPPMKPILSMTLAILTGLATRDALAASPENPLRGTWALVAADKILPGGTRASDYGKAPKGRLMIDAEGRYSLQIFKSERAQFAAGDKAQGSPDEFAAAVLGSSTHYGKLEVDASQGLLVFKIEGASFPNWEGTVQKRAYTLEGDVLTYRVPPRPDGSIPLSVWKKLD